MSTLDMRRRQALHTYASIQSARHDMRAGEAEFRRSTVPVLAKPQAVRKRTLGETVTLVCERFAASGWVLLLAIVFAAAILNARSTGALP
jgi:hypothetical protein